MAEKVSGTFFRTRAQDDAGRRISARSRNEVPDTFLVLAAAVLWAMFSAAAIAQQAGEDTVILKPRDVGEGSARLRGEVVDYTGQVLRLRTAGGAERKIPAADVARVETKASAEQQAADELFARGDFGAALSRYRTALQASHEPRQWVRRQIMAQIVWCLRNLGQWDQAGEHFLILLESDPTTMHFDCIPLAWTSEVPAASVTDKAGEWMRDRQRPAAVLLGASQMLNTDQRLVALGALKELLSQDDRRVTWLAFAQLWRAGSSNATDEQWAGFAQKIESADESLRAGAYYLFGTARASAQPEDAALALLKLPLIYPREFELSAQALLIAGQCLQTIGREAQAAGLYRELLNRFGQSVVAQDARLQLERLAPAAPAGDNGT